MGTSFVTLLNQASRRFVRERGFTLTALLTLALCIAANIAIFAIVDAVLLRALPYDDSDDLVVIYNAYPGAGTDRGGASFTNYWDRREGVDAFSHVSLYQQGSGILGKEGSPVRIPRDRVSPEFFDMMGIAIEEGRTFTDDMMYYDNWLNAVITDTFWKEEFNSDPNVIGKTFMLDSQSVQVIGRLAPGFTMPHRQPKLFMPAASGRDENNPQSRHNGNFQMLGRLAKGTTLENAQSQMDAFNQVQLEDDPYKDLVIGARFHTTVANYHEDLVRDFKPILILLQAGVLFLLLIGAVNLINLLLIRASNRSKELAVCQALGAGRRHIASEVIAETVLLTFVGGLLGLILGYFGITLLTQFGTDQLPLGSTISLGYRVALVSLGGSVLLGVLLAIPILWFNLHNHLAPILQSVTRGGTASKAAQKVRHGFIIFQIGIAFVLLSCSAMMGISLKKLMDVQPGFQPDNVLTGTISMPWQNYQEQEQVEAFVYRLVDKLKTLPGVKYAGTTSGLPMGGNLSKNAMAIEGHEIAAGESIRTHYSSGNCGDYWQALGIPLIQGRLLNDADRQGDARVCVVDQDFVDYYWPDVNPIGRRVSNGPELKEEDMCTVVGVVGSVKFRDLTENNKHGAAYFPQKDYNSRNLFIVLRTEMDPTAMAATLRSTMLELDPSMPVEEIKTMGGLIDETLSSQKSPTLLAGIFAVVALLLAAIGTYGVLSYAVAQRGREIGVRMALGAQPEHIRNQFFALGMKLLTAGIMLGLVGSFFAGRAMQTILFDMPSFHAPSAIGTTIIMGTVTLISCLMPAMRAAGVSPMKSLTNE